MEHQFEFWCQEREKAQRGEEDFFPFRVLWCTLTPARQERLLAYSYELNGGRGSDVHWVSNLQAFQDDSLCFFAPIWRVGKTGDEALHSLLETRERERAAQEN